MELKDDRDRDLIRFVKSEKGIWESREKRNTHLLGKQWSNVAKKMKADKAIVQKRWKKLVQKMRIEVSLMPSGMSDSDIDEYHESDFEHFEAMRFLIPGLQQARRDEEESHKSIDGNLVAALRERTVAAPNNNRDSQLNSTKTSKSCTSQSPDDGKDIDYSKQFLMSLISHAIHIPPHKAVPCQIEIFKAIDKYKPVDFTTLLPPVHDNFIDLIDSSDDEESIKDDCSNWIKGNEIKSEQLLKITKFEKSQPPTTSNIQQPSPLNSNNQQPPPTNSNNQQPPSAKAEQQNNYPSNLQYENTNPYQPFLFTCPTPTTFQSVLAPQLGQPIVNNMFYPTQIIPNNNHLAQLNVPQQTIQNPNNPALLQQQTYYPYQNPPYTYQQAFTGSNPYNQVFIPQAPAINQQQQLDCNRIYSIFAQQQFQQNTLSDHVLGNQNLITQVQAHQQNLSILTAQQLNPNGQRQINVISSISEQMDGPGVADNMCLAPQLESDNQEEDSPSSGMEHQEPIEDQSL